jgi:hypothetical protein
MFRKPRGPSPPVIEEPPPRLAARPLGARPGRSPAPPGRGPRPGPGSSQAAGSLPDAPRRRRPSPRAPCRRLVAASRPSCGARWPSLPSSCGFKSHTRESPQDAGSGRARLLRQPFPHHPQRPPPARAAAAAAQLAPGARGGGGGGVSAPRRAAALSVRACGCARSVPPLARRWAKALPHPRRMRTACRPSFVPVVARGARFECRCKGAVSRSGPHLIMYVHLSYICK